MRRVLALCVLLVGVCVPLRAQDGLNLPTELYILLNEGKVQRYGLGASGVQTVTSEGAFVLDFAVAPDDRMLAYRTQEGLFLRDMYADAPPQLLEDATASYPDIRGKGETLAWSADGVVLAYTTFGNGRVHFRNTNTFQNLDVGGLQDVVWSSDGNYLAMGAVGGVWWIYLREPSQMRLVSAVSDASGVAWLPNGLLYFTPNSGGVILMDLTNNNQQTVIRDNTSQYFLPFVVAPYLYVLQGSSTQARFVAIADEGGSIVLEERGQNDVDPTTLRWSPDGAFLIAFSGGVLALVEPISGEGFTLPINSASAYSWGAYRPSVDNLPLSSNGYYIAQAFSTGIAQVWQLPTDGTLPETITPAEESVTEFALSPDKRNIAYVSAGKLWYYVLGSSTSTELYEIATLGNEQESATPAFSIDGNTLYYRDERAEGKGIWYANLDTGETFLLVADTQSDTYRQPRLSTSVSAMLLTVNETRTILLDTNTQAITELGVFAHATWAGSQVILQSSDGLSIVNASDINPTAQVLFATGEQVLDVIRLNNETLRVLVSANAPSQVRVLDVPFSGGNGVVVGTVGYVYAPRLSPDGAFVAGYTYPNGALMLISVATGAQKIDNVGNSLSGFVWQ